MKAQHLYGQVVELADLLGRDMNNFLRDRDLSVARAHALWALHENGAMPQHLLARHLEVTPRNVTGLVDGLATMGLAARAPHPTDRRSFLVSLTTQGQTFASMLEAERDTAATKLFHSWSREELEMFSQLLSRCIGDLRSEVRHDA